MQRVIIYVQYNIYIYTCIYNDFVITFSGVAVLIQCQESSPLHVES